MGCSPPPLSPYTLGFGSGGRNHRNWELGRAFNGGQEEQHELLLLRLTVNPIQSDFARIAEVARGRLCSWEDDGPSLLVGLERECILDCSPDFSSKAVDLPAEELLQIATPGKEENYTAPKIEPLLSDIPSVKRLKEPKSVYKGGNYCCPADSPSIHIALAFEVPGGWYQEKTAMVVPILQVQRSVCYGEF